MKTRELRMIFKYLAIAGNVMYVLWILYNGMNEGFQGTTLEIVSYLGLILLLIINSILLSLRQEK